MEKMIPYYMAGACFGIALIGLEERIHKHASNRR